MDNSNITTHPTVFISYSHDSEEHKKWVLKLSTDLMNHGVDVILDQWDLQVGNDLNFYMENGISKSKLVICICSDGYVKKADNRTRGTGYETMIISQSMLFSVNTNHIIPIVKNNTGEQKTPVCLGSKLYIDFDNGEYVSKFTELINKIYNNNSKPPLGESPFNNSIANIIETKTKIESVKYNNPDTKGHVSFEYDNNNGKYIIGVQPFDFVTKWSAANNDAIYAYGMIGYNKTIKEFPEPQELKNFDFSSNTRRINVGEIIIFKNNCEHFLAVKVTKVDSKSHGKENDYMEFEYKVIV